MRVYKELILCICVISLAHFVCAEINRFVVTP